MSQDVNELSKQPTPDKAEDNAFSHHHIPLVNIQQLKQILMVLNTKVPIKMVNGKY